MWSEALKEICEHASFLESFNDKYSINEATEH